MGSLHTYTHTHIHTYMRHSHKVLNGQLGAKRKALQQAAAERGFLIWTERAFLVPTAHGGLPNMDVAEGCAAVSHPPLATRHAVAQAESNRAQFRQEGAQFRQEGAQFRQELGALGQYYARSTAVAARKGSNVTSSGDHVKEAEDRWGT